MSSCGVGILEIKVSLRVWILGLLQGLFASVPGKSGRGFQLLKESTQAGNQGATKCRKLCQCLQFRRARRAVAGGSLPHSLLAAASVSSMISMPVAGARCTRSEPATSCAGRSKRGLQRRCP